MHFIIAFHLAQFTGPDNQKIDINPMAVVSVRPLRNSEHYGKGTRCLIHTSDGKFSAVTEDCDTVIDRLEEPENED